MSVEVLAIIIAAASLFVALGGGLFAGFAWMLRRMDERFVQAEVSVNERFNKAEVSLSERFNKVDEKFDRIYDEMREIRTELTEVKISVARLEGPRQRLILPR